MGLPTALGQGEEMRTEEPAAAFLAVAAGRAWPLEAELFRGRHLLTLGTKAPSHASVF